MTIDKKVENMTLKGLRLLSGKTIREMAERVNLSTKTYRAYEQAPEHFSIRQAQALCELLEIDINDFMKLKGEF